GDMQELYAPLIERDLEAIPAAIRAFRREQTSDELWHAVAQFAILAFAPSQHAKHALLAVLAAHDLREEAGERWDELLTECARYAAQSRQPWSEPPILDAPPIEARQRGDLDELRAAVSDRDRLRAERWLAFRLESPNVLRDMATVATEDLSDFGHKLIITSAASRLSEILGDKGRYAVLRTAVWEIVAYRGDETMEQRSLPKLVARCVEEHGSIESAHAVFLFDARETMQVGAASAIPTGRGAHAYALARDYGQYLKAQAVAGRLRVRHPDAALDEFVEACRYNLEHAPSFEEWSFA
ncbi:MAG: hypothetical protein JJE51_08565, partial [Thermoanaerobaculia bacterium]|nr:hypothetical protein [Thermoanaerobaculia bacterium]